MVVAGLVGVVLTIALVREADRRTDIAVAAITLEPGTRLDVDDISWTPARLDDSVPIVTRDDLAGLEGMVLTRRIADGDIISPNDLRPAAATGGLRAMSIPISRSRAVNGDLAPGDRIDVIHGSTGMATVVVTDVEVIGVDDDGSGGALRSGVADLTITLAVDAEQAQRLTAALSGGEIIIVRATGAAAVGDRSPVTVGEGTP